MATTTTKTTVFTWMARTATNTAMEHLRTKSERDSRNCEDLDDQESFTTAFYKFLID